MGSIHERLQNLQEERKLERDTFASEKELLKKQKEELMRNETLMLQNQREQFYKFETLKSLGITDMIQDATGGLRIEMEWPLSRDERRAESQRIREELNKAVAQMPTRRSFDFRKIDEEYLEKLQKDGDINGYNREKGNAYWESVSSYPTVGDDLVWNTDVKITIKEAIPDYHLNGVFSRTGKVSQVSVVFNGDVLQIVGEQTVFDNVIPQDLAERKDILENAFVMAFDNPKDIRPRSNVPDHTHPRSHYI